MAKIQIESLKQTPNIGDLLRAKEEHRMVYANRSVSEKLRTVERLRDATRVIQKSRAKIIHGPNQNSDFD